jgi:hypothetical protein
MEVTLIAGQTSFVQGAEESTMNNKRFDWIVPSFIVAGLVLPLLTIYHVKAPANETEAAARVVLSLFEQIVITASAAIVKPLYQLLSLLIVILLWKRTDTDLVAIRRAVLAFFIGENACAINYLFFHESSLLMELLHNYGMVLCFGLVVYSVMEAFDKRFFHFSERNKKCALLPLCGRCYKYGSRSCNLRLLFLIVIPATGVLAAIPLTGLLGAPLYAGKVFGSSVIFGHPFLYQVLDIRIYPLASLIPIAVSFILLLMQAENGFHFAKIFFAMGIGLLGFSLMRFFFFWGYQNNPLWADAWEEITELLFIALIFWIVLRIRVVSSATAERDSRKAVDAGSAGRHKTGQGEGGIEDR